MLRLLRDGDDAGEQRWHWQVPGAQAVMTTRQVGNIGAHVGDDPARVAANRERAAGLLATTTDRVAGVTQVHGADVWLDLGRGDELAADVRWDVAGGVSPIEADALVTARPGITLAVGVADCLPIALVHGSAIAAIHAGWRGLEAGVIEAAAAALRRAAGSSVAVADAVPRALVGPGICAQCMEVGEEVAARFDASVIRRIAGRERPYLDARADAKRRLEALGFDVTHIDVCTVEEGVLFSHRGDTAAGAPAGRQALLVCRHGSADAPA